MPATTNISGGGLVTFNIQTNGKAIPDTLNVLSVQVEKRVNRISTAKIILLDGQADTGKFEASSSATFVPGNEVTIEAGYDSVNTLIFKGIITSQSIRIDPLNGSVLEVECRDTAVKMTVGRKCLSFSNQKDSDIIAAIIATYSGLIANVTATETTWPEQVQYYATDWDFILSRAEANGLIVTTLNGSIAVAKPDAATSPVLLVQYGNNLIACDVVLDSLTQIGNAKAGTWDYKNQAVSTGEAQNNIPGPGNLSSKKLAEVVGLEAYDLQTAAPLQAADLTEWSKAQIVKSGYSKIRGEVKCSGTHLADPGKYITLQGLGDRFNGDHLISGIVQDISDGNWTTEISVGLSPNWFTEEPDVIAPPASGLLPGTRGLLTGTVKKMHGDPDSQYRILVNVPLFDQNGAGIWARLSNFYSTSGAGAFFLPEAGDEVILGFLNEDPRCPVILGSLYSSPKLKPFTGLEPNQKNNLKAIVSKSGVKVEFDDENKILTIATPAKNTVIISDQEKQITIKDEHSNSIVLSASGIAIKSANISLEASENITLKGQQSIQIQSPGGDVVTKGLNIKQTADLQYAAEGSQMAKIDAGMELTLKAAMVMIN